LRHLMRHSKKKRASVFADCSGGKGELSGSCRNLNSNRRKEKKSRRREKKTNPIWGSVLMEGNALVQVAFSLVRGRKGNGVSAVEDEAFARKKKGKSFSAHAEVIPCFRLRTRERGEEMRVFLYWTTQRGRKRMGVIWYAGNAARHGPRPFARKGSGD